MRPSVPGGTLWEMAGEQRKGSVPDGKACLPDLTGAGFDSVWRAPQGFGRPAIRLSKRQNLVEP